MSRYKILNDVRKKINEHFGVFNFELENNEELLDKLVEYTLGFIYLEKTNEFMIGYSILDRQTEYMIINKENIDEMIYNN